jgi:hypothetical protein
MGSMSSNHARQWGSATNSKPTTSFFGVQQENNVQPKITNGAVDRHKGTGKVGSVITWCNRQVCRLSSHDFWALAYPPARRWECHRCGVIVEDAPTHALLPERRRVPRHRAHKAGGPSAS